MGFREDTWYSERVGRYMNIKVYGWGGTPMLGIPCQDSMSNNYADFGMIDTISDYINDGRIQFFCVDTVDKDSWSDLDGDKGHRAWMQEMYFQYICEEVIPYIFNVNGTGKAPIVMGCSLGATHAAILFLRRPDLFSGMLAMSGIYDAEYFFDGWMDENLYNNSPVHFMANMPNDHFYVDMYNHRKGILCIGQGAWEDEGRRTTAIMRDIFAGKGIDIWCDFWGYDVNHDWPWWKIQIRYFLPHLLGE